MVATRALTEPEATTIQDYHKFVQNHNLSDNQLQHCFDNRKRINEMPFLDNNNERGTSFLSSLDFGIEVFKEKVPGKGEDSYLYSFNPNAGIVGVFDGCGGSGAKKYEKLKGKTGAYLASRVVCGATRDWFRETMATGVTNAEPHILKTKIKTYLELCKNVGGSVTSLKGSMAKEFPTTAAIILASVKEKNLQATCIWAGDSRCYMLDESGLMQLTEDDLDGLDAMDNLTADGILTNVITTSKDFTLHQKTIAITKPGILFTATDGCFGYLSTPMEFEFILLSSLLSSDSVAAFEKKLSMVIQKITGDDYSLCGMGIGFGSLSNMKKQLEERYGFLVNKYIANLKEKTQEEKCDLWKEYKLSYEKYIS